MAEQAPPNAPTDFPSVPTDFVDRMNQIPKFVASTTLQQAAWNATVIGGDLAMSVAKLKQSSGKNLLKYGNGPLDTTLMQHGLIDDFHLFLTPVAVGSGQHLFENIDSTPHLALRDVTRFDNGVVVLVYTPK